MRGIFLLLFGKELPAADVDEEESKRLGKELGPQLPGNPRAHRDANEAAQHRREDHLPLHQFVLA